MWSLPVVWSICRAFPMRYPSGSRWGYRLQDSVMEDALIRSLFCGSRLLPGPEKGPLKKGLPLERFKGQPYIMGQTAEFVAQMFNISREEMDEVALRSHHNAERATRGGDFKEEIVPVPVPQKEGKPPVAFEKDEHFIPGLTMDKLAALKPAFIPDIGKVTAGNASGINDGASAMVIMSEEKAAELDLTPLAYIRGVGYGGCHPSIMGAASPVPSVRDLLKRSGLKMNDFELIEAFAAQYLCCEKELGLNREITNVNGSGIGLGHPIFLDRVPHHGDPSACHEKTRKDPRFGYALRRWRRFHVHGFGNTLRKQDRVLAGRNGNLPSKGQMFVALSISLIYLRELSVVNLGIPLIRREMYDQAGNFQS